MRKVEVRSFVEVVKEPSRPVLGKYRVEVWGAEPHDYVRIYEIQSRSDILAQQEGITRFEEEMSQILPEDE